MIAANELRIGNWVLPEHNLDGDYHQVKILRDEGTINDYVESWYSPIPLTPSILEKCGFERGDNLDRDGHYSYERDGIVITNNETSFEGGWGEEIYMKVDHLHQLQNLYFALTGEELTVNL